MIIKIGKCSIKIKNVYLYLLIITAIYTLFVILILQYRPLLDYKINVDNSPTFDSLCLSERYPSSVHINNSVISRHGEFTSQYSKVLRRTRNHPRMPNGEKRAKIRVPCAIEPFLSCSNNVRKTTVNQIGGVANISETIHAVGNISVAKEHSAASVPNLEDIGALRFSREAGEDTQNTGVYDTIITIVISSASNFRRRHCIRDTWGSIADIR